MSATVLSVSSELKVSAEAPFEIDLPELPDVGALCIGLTIEWRHDQALRGYALKHTLADEHARAARFGRPEDSLRNLLGRSLLRRVASHYGGMEPMQVIRSNTWGKPELVGCYVGCNVSYAGNQVWVALSRFPRVGIDIELVSAPKEFHDIVAGFHPDEIAALRRMPDGKLSTLRCWNRKEAVSKATGMGVALPLRAYCVECDARQSGWLRVPPPDTERGNWTTVDLPIGKEYVGALAIEGRCDRVSVVRLKITG